MIATSPMRRILLLAVTAAVMSGAEPAVDLGASYRWRSMPLGGGGYFTAILPHPTRPGVLFVASDMTGPFRRGTAEELFVDASQRNPKRGVLTSAVSDLAIHPARPDTVWACVRGSGLVRSRDGGLSYELVHPVRSFAKTEGPFIALDPANPDIIYRGTAYDGLYRSSRGGDPGTWERVEVAPGLSQAAHLVAFAPQGPVADARSQVIYVAAAGSGVHASRDGGRTFGLLTAAGNPAAVRQLHASADGSLYAVTPKQLLRHRAGEGWTDLTPAFPSDTGPRAFAVHPQHPKDLILCYTWELFRSRDGGATWQGPLRDQRRGGPMQRTGIPGWFDKPVNAAPAHLAFDPHASARLYLSDAYMFWQCDDVWADAPVFAAQWRGLENTAVIDLAVPAADDGAGTVLLAAIADVRGVRWSSTTAPPTQKLGQAIMNTDGKGGDDACSVATSEGHPRRWYLAMNRGWRGPSYGMRSDDGGQTWAWMADPIPEEPNHGGAKIAVSATDPDLLVYAPGNRLTARVSGDGGRTWSQVQGLPWLSGVTRNFNNDHYVAADAVDGQTFYAVRPDGSDDGLYVSRDGGRNWARGGGKLPRRTGHGGHDTFPIHLAPRPGQAGSVVVSIGREGVFRSDDFGATCTRLERFAPPSESFVFVHDQRLPLHMAPRPTAGVGCLVAWGAPAPGGTVPALYVLNHLDGEPERRLFRSLDDGATWQRICRDDFHLLHPTRMAASRQVFGQVFISDSGLGVVVAEPQPR